MRTPQFKGLLRLLGILMVPWAGLLFLFSLVDSMAIPTLLLGLFVSASSVYLITGAPHLIKAVDRFPKVESKFDGGKSFTQTGGIRWGRSFLSASGWCTIPFARIRVSREEIVLSVSSFLPFMRRTFTFPRTSVRRLRWKRGILSLGLKIEHDMAECPPFILFWVTNRSELTRGLREFGFEVA